MRTNHVEIDVISRWKWVNDGYCLFAGSLASIHIQIDTQLSHKYTYIAERQNEIALVHRLMQMQMQLQFSQQQQKIFNEKRWTKDDREREKSFIAKYFFGWNYAIFMGLCVCVFVLLCLSKYAIKSDHVFHNWKMCVRKNREQLEQHSMNAKKKQKQILFASICVRQTLAEIHTNTQRTNIRRCRFLLFFFLLSTTQSQRKPAGLSANACGRPNSNSTWISVFVFATEKVSVLYFCCFLLEMASTRKRENSHKRRVETDLASFRPPTRKQEQVSRISKFILNKKWIRCWRKSKKEKKNADRAG